MIPGSPQLDMPNLFDSLIRNNLEVIVFPIREYWLDIGHTDDFEKANWDYETIRLIFVNNIEVIKVRFLIIGLGWMGKRRIRCLKALGYETIAGFDLRQDRKEESEQKYGIKTYPDFQFALKELKPSALIISVPPDIHHIYMRAAIENDLHFFVEASVVDTDMELVNGASRKKGIIAAPSATLLFHPAIKKIADIINEGIFGKVSNICCSFRVNIFLTGTLTKTFSDYYVSNPITGGARKMPL